MVSKTTFKVLLVFLHIFSLLVGSFAIELVLFLRKESQTTSNLPRLTLSSFFHTFKELTDVFLRPYILTSWRRFGTLIFGLTCFSSIGFIANLTFFYYNISPEYRPFLEHFWMFDAIMCTVLVFLVIPIGLSHKFVKLRSNMELRQKVLSSFGFVFFWIVLGSVSGFIILRDMFFFMKNKNVGFIWRSVYHMCGFGLFFVAVLVGFSGVYLPYLLYIINRDASSVRQLEKVIADCNKAKRDLKNRMLENNFDLSDDSADDEFFQNMEMPIPEFSNDSNRENAKSDDHLLTSYRPAEMCMNREETELESSIPTTKIQSFFKKLKSIKRKVALKIYIIKHAKQKTQRPEAQLDECERNFNMWMMMNDIKNDLDYLKMLKQEKESSSKVTGKIFIFIKCIVAFCCMFNCYKVCKRSILMLSSDYSHSMDILHNQKVLTKVYFEFMRDDIVSSILNEVLENLQLPTTFDFVISRANSILLACVMISSVGYFLDFARMLLKTRYLKKNKFMSDSSMGLAMACFMILTFPSQFIMVIPFLPRQLKLTLTDFLFQNDIYVWFGLRYRFDLIVMFTLFFTFFGVLLLQFSRSFNKVSYQVGCNV